MRKVIPSGRRAPRRAAFVSVALFASALAGCEATLGQKTEDDSSGSDPSGEGPTDLGPPATDPGRVTLHRLNNTEYNNTVHDLLGVSSRPADNFPLDGSGAGFDNLAKVLTLSETHLVAYFDAAEALVTEVLGDANLRNGLVPCDVAAEGSTCIEATLRGFLPRAFRRSVDDLELTKWIAKADEALAAGDTPEQALTILLQGALLSPHFLFRVELDSEPTSLEPHPLGDYELASRLSYFLWSTMPDEQLFAAAEGGTLGDEAVLREQVTRMLADPNAQALVENFAGQWLYLRKVDEIQPDGTMFPGFDDALRASMKAETAGLFEQLLFGGLPVDALLTANFTFVDDRLAEHYGLPSPGSDGLVQVDLTGNLERPGGLLSHGSILSVTSHPSSTSPVLRGKWVLGQLLCAEVKPPPPDVNINLNDAAITGDTLREKLEQHRADPTCNSCHEVMDPIGLGLENYDAIGAFRTTDGGFPIDASGELPDGSTFSGPDELRHLIAENDAFLQCLVKNLYTYALGRVPEKDPTHMDGQTLAAIEQLLGETSNLTDAIVEIVTSATFTTRRGDPEEGSDEN